MRFREHALNRFRKRRPDLFPPAPKPPALRDVEWLARASYDGGRMITRQEARAIVGGGLNQWRHGDLIFRTGGDGRGIWIAMLNSRGERVLSYVIRRWRSRTWSCRIPLVRRRAVA